MTPWMLIAAKATLAMLIALAASSIARRARASFRHAIFVALFAFLLLLPFAPSVIPAMNVTVPAPAASQKNVVVTHAVTQPATHTTNPRWSPSITDFYFAGILLMFGSLALGVLRLRRFAARGEIWLDGTRLATEIGCSNGIRRAVLVVLSGEISVPMTFGFRKQTIVLPANAPEWDSDSLERALRHELEHVRRDDWMLQLVARAACALYWPHPLVWIALRRFCAEAERACDDAVVRAFEPATYANQLVTLARTLTHRPRVPALAMASPTRLSERVRAILDPAQRRGPHGRFATIATLVVMTAALAVFGSVRLIAAEVGTYDDDSFHESVVKASERGNVDRLDQFIANGLDVNKTLDGDGTPLLIAARHGHIKAVEFLLDRGADPNVPSPGDGNPLIAAAGNGHIDIVRMLLDRGARIDEVVPGDENALITAAWHGQGDVVKVLIARGANVNLGVWEDASSGRGAEFRTALRMARRAGHDGIAQLLINAGARQ
jgi:beta-lactamase regulating signal transducer with metallopeptidase domain